MAAARNHRECLWLKSKISYSGISKAKSGMPSNGTNLEEALSEIAFSKVLLTVQEVPHCGSTDGRNAQVIGKAVLPEPQA